MSSNLMSTSTSGNTLETFFSNRGLVTGIFTAIAFFIVIIGGSLIWFLCRAGLICVPEHNNLESPPEPAKSGRRSEKVFFAPGAPNSREKPSPHPTMGGVFPSSTLLPAEEARRRRGEPRDLHREAPQPTRRPNLQPVMEGPTPNLVPPSATRTWTPPSGPYTPIRIERHPYAQAMQYPVCHSAD